MEVVRNPVTREVTEGIPMWIYWSLQEGTLGVDPKLQVATTVPCHRSFMDTDAPALRRGWATDYRSGHLLQARFPRWWRALSTARGRPVDPYGPASPEFVVGAEFAEMWVSALAHCQERFQAPAEVQKRTLGRHRRVYPDSFPVFDSMRELLCYRRLNHGYKMIGVGELVAQTICGDKSGSSPVSLLTLRRG